MEALIFTKASQSEVKSALEAIATQVGKTRTEAIAGAAKQIPVEVRINRQGRTDDELLVDAAAAVRKHFNGVQSCKLEIVKKSHV